MPIIVFNTIAGTTTAKNKVIKDCPPGRPAITFINIKNNVPLKTVPTGNSNANCLP